MLLLLKILYAFAKVGVVAYGGGPSMIPLMQEEVVDVNHWLTNAEFVDALAMGNALPGPIATKMSAYTGFKLAGIPGAIMGTLGTVLPSAVAMLMLAALFFQFKDYPKVQAVLKAVRPAVVALLLVTVYEVYPQSITSWHTGLIAVVTLVVIIALRLHPAIAILAAALVGFFVY